MSIPIIDACVAIKWFLPEKDYERAAILLAQYDKMVVPDLFFIEFDAILTKKVRQKILDKQESEEIYNEIRNFPLTTIPYSMIKKLAFDLSASLPVTLYDACYLALAIEYKEMFHTADRRFIRGIQKTPFSMYVKAL